MHLSYQRALEGQISLHKHVVSKSRNGHVDERIGKKYTFNPTRDSLYNRESLAQLDSLFLFEIVSSIYSYCPLRAQRK